MYRSHKSQLVMISIAVSILAIGIVISFVNVVILQG